MKRKGILIRCGGRLGANWRVVVEGLKENGTEDARYWKHTDGDLEQCGLPRPPSAKTRMVAFRQNARRSAGYSWYGRDTVRIRVVNRKSLVFVPKIAHYALC